LVAVHDEAHDAQDAQDAADQPAGQRQLAPLDLPMVPFVVGGLIVWLIVAVILAALHTSLAEQGRGEWLRISIAGFLVGLPGLALMLVHDRNRRRRRAANGSDQR
jgi:hypothetical protein